MKRLVGIILLLWAFCFAFHVDAAQWTGGSNGFWNVVTNWDNGADNTYPGQAGSTDIVAAA